MKGFAKVIRYGAAAGVLALASSLAFAALVPMDKLSASTTVSTTGLDLNQPSDVAVLYSRISVAARAVCGPHAVNGAAYSSKSYAQCYGDTVGHTVAAVNSAALTAYYQQQQADQRAISIASK
jgi:UrcA family protein